MADTSLSLNVDTVILWMSKIWGKIQARIDQAFSRTFFAFFSRFYEFEFNTTSDWLNRMV